MDGRTVGGDGSGSTSLRATLFAENTRDSLYSQTVFDAIANKNISRVVNVGRIATKGVELAANAQDVGIKGLDLLGSLTFADSIIKKTRALSPRQATPSANGNPTSRSGARRRWPATASTPAWTATLAAPAAPSTEL